jgi:hypothetical protein
MMSPARAAQQQRPVNGAHLVEQVVVVDPHDADDQEGRGVGRERGPLGLE